MSDRVGDRRRGALVGLAVGDALGAAVEFRSPGTFEPVTGYRSGGPHGLAAGEWTDDTSMAVALATSIADVGWDLGDQARRYLDWWRHGTYSVTGRCFDIGNTVSQALNRFEQTGDPRTSGSDSEYSAGNGSIMRLAPVPVAYLDEGLDRVIERSVESSLPTHRAPQCLSACAWMGAVLAGLMQGLDRDEVLDPDGPITHRVEKAVPLHTAVAEVVAGSYRTRRPPEIRGTGYVVDSLEAALWAFVHADDFERAVLAAVNLGDDADTTGAVCGQIAGAYWGHEGIPAQWRADLARPDLLGAGFDRLIEKDTRR
jgi:ADP-ribosyl-[dinitrogen reductase] hydrolase